MIDFSAVQRREITLYTLGQTLSVSDLQEATEASIEKLLGIIQQADDMMITFVPHDPEAHDPFAPPEQQYIGWTLGHLVAHVTATSEESAATSSMLARGLVYPAEPRLRYETPWQEIDTQAKAIQRLQESRRMRLAYLDTWPDVPHLDTFRVLSERALEMFGPLNATAHYLLGLSHEVGHYAQFEEVLRQARENATGLE